MEAVVLPAVEKVSEAVSATMASNKKVDALKRENFREVSDNTPLTNDHGVKQANTDIWLSASVDERKGPQLLEDNFAREKVCLEPPPLGA